MICQHCQQSIPDDSKFCPFCGEATKNEPGQKPVEVQKSKKEKRPKSKMKIILFSLLGVVIILVGVYFGTYFAAKSKAQAGEYTTAGKLLLVPAVTRLHDPQLEPYIRAGLLFDQGDYEGAEKAFDSLAQDNYLNAAEEKKYSIFFKGMNTIADNNGLGLAVLRGYQDIAALAKDGFPIAVEALPDIKELVYQKGIELYGQGNSTARYLFEELDSYRRSADYMILLDAKYGYPKNNYLSVVKLIGFEDANKIILSVYPEKFLKGTWKTSDGRYSFTLKENLKENSKGGYTSNYTLPCTTTDFPYYSIDDGLYYLTNDNNERKNAFQFSIVSANTITVYCYKDRNTYRLYRQ